jgi:hypothetical protein
MSRTPRHRNATPARHADSTVEDLGAAFALRAARNPY